MLFLLHSSCRDTSYTYTTEEQRRCRSATPAAFRHFIHYAFHLFLRYFCAMFLDGPGAAMVINLFKRNGKIKYIEMFILNALN